MKTGQEELTESNADEKRVHNTVLMTAGTLVSRATGLLRTWSMAFALGAGTTASAYNIANTLPNIIYELVVGGTVSTAFLPILMLVSEQRGDEAAKRYCSNMMSIISIILVALSIAGIIFAPQVVATQTFTSAGGNVVEQAIFLFRLFSVQVLLYGMGAISQGIINAGRSFFLTSIAPALNNCIVICTMLLYSAIVNIDSVVALNILGIGTTSGVLAQTAILFIQARKNGWHWKPIVDIGDKYIVETIKLAGPTLLFVVAQIVATSCRNAFSLSITSSGPAMLAYAWLWFQLPYSVIAVSLSSTMFTEISDDAAKNDDFMLLKHVGDGLRKTIILMLPCSACLIAVAQPLIGMFQIGAMNNGAINQIVLILQSWAVALPFYSIIFYMEKAYAGTRGFKQFSLICCLLVPGQIILYALLPKMIPDNSIIGIPIADVAYYALFSLVAVSMFQKKHGTFITLHGIVDIAKALAASVIAFILMHVVDVLLGAAFIGIGIAGYLAESVMIGGIGLVASLLVMRAMRVRDAKIFDKFLSR